MAWGPREPLGSQGVRVLAGPPESRGHRGDLEHEVPMVPRDLQGLRLAQVRGDQQDPQGTMVPAVYLVRWERVVPRVQPAGAVPWGQPGHPVPMDRLVLVNRVPREVQDRRGSPALPDQPDP